ncbi:MAG: DOMON-like domain-containing protein [Caulobacteraceae bacterium]|nr:DOMON-like domain-containing protein [Caulobacteraceae bacterium]
MRLPLVPHPTLSHGGLTLDVEVRRKGHALSLEYGLAGPVEAVRWPVPASRQRTDGLWRTTCLEAFVQTSWGYVEYNLSPSGAWAAYGFDEYRKGMRGHDMSAPLIMTSAAPGHFTMTVDLALPAEVTGAVSLAAVIEGLDGAISYWALVHPSDKPDFHHPDSFVLDLP